MSKHTRLYFTALWLVLLSGLLLASVFFGRASLQSDIFALLPNENHTLAKAEQALFAKHKNNVVFSIQGKKAVQVYDALAKQLAELGLSLKQSQLTPQAISQFYLPYKHLLASEEFLAALKNKADYARYYQQQLTSLTNTWVSHTLASDASLATASFLHALQAQSQSVTLYQGRLKSTTAPDTWLLIANVNPQDTGLRSAPRLEEKIQQQLAQLKQRYPEVTVRYSGVLFHNAQNARQAQFEMNLFGGLSAILLLLVVSSIFTRFYALVGAGLTIFSALLGGAAGLFWLIGQVHILTLVFAVTLIGIAIDYAFHAMADLAANKQKGYSVALKRAFLVALITTLLGYASFIAAPMSILRDVAIFVCFGLASAWLFVRFALPSMATQFAFRPWVTPRTAQLIRLFSVLQRWRYYFAAIAVVGITALLMIKQPKFNDDIAVLNASSTELISNEQIHSQLLGQHQLQRVLVAGQSVEQVLQREEWLKKQVNSANQNALVQGLSQWLPSQQRQQQIYTQLKAAQHQGIMTLAEQFKGSPIALTQTPKWLDFSTWQQSNLAQLNPLITHVPAQGYYSVFTIKGLDNATVKRLISTTSHFYLFDKRADISQSLSQYRHVMAKVLIVALFAIMAVFMLRFGVAQGFKASLWLVLALTTTVALVIQWQSWLSIFHLLGMLLVLALAIDYWVFYQHSGYQAANVLAISLSAVSSMLVFGMLALSHTPAIAHFGTTVMIGLIVVYFIAPLTVRKKHE